MSEPEQKPKEFALIDSSLACWAKNQHGQFETRELELWEQQRNFTTGYNSDWYSLVMWHQLRSEDQAVRRKAFLDSL